MYYIRPAASSSHCWEDQYSPAGPADYDWDWADLSCPQSLHVQWRVLLYFPRRLRLLRSKVSECDTLAGNCVFQDVHTFMQTINPLMPTVATCVQHPVPDQVKPSFVIFDIRHSDTQPWASECPDVKKITNDSLTQSGTGCIVVVTTWQQLVSKS